MSERAQTIIVVTIVTVLVWLYAEGQSLADPLEREVEVAMEVGADSHLQVRLTPASQRFAIRVVGPKRPVDELARSLDRPIALRLGQYGVDAMPGTQEKPIVEILGKHPLFAGKGLNIRSVEPEVLKYTVDRLMEATLDVTIGDLAGLQVEGAVRIDPAKAVVRIPETALTGAGMDEQRLVAEIDRAALRDLQAGETQTVEARLKVKPAGDAAAVQVLPATAKVTFTVKANRREIERTAVPIHVAGPIPELWQYEVTLGTTFIPSVKLTGPSDVLGDDVRVIGYVYFSSDDLERGVTEKRVYFSRLPEGVTVEPEVIMVPVTIARRPTGTTVPTTGGNGSGEGGGE